MARRDSTPYTNFYPRPPRGGRRHALPFRCTDDHISIHALREEGDAATSPANPRKKNFYPRPPRGGRLMPLALVALASLFLSTPSARRATVQAGLAVHAGAFLSTPSARRVTYAGDFLCTSYDLFLSTPSARRATPCPDRPYNRTNISIHALREEGDLGAQVRAVVSRAFLSTPSARRATTGQGSKTLAGYFYPRPPRGGRLYALCAGFPAKLFLSTPSARRATVSPPVHNVR